MSFRKIASSLLVPLKGDPHTQKRTVHITVRHAHSGVKLLGLEH